MTRIAINHSCKQFNKICVYYHAVITNWYPSTPHKGANGDIRHVNTGPCLAGRLAHYVSNSRVQIRSPHQKTKPAVLHHNQMNQALITEEVQELLAKQAIKEAQPSPNSFISQLFLVEKKGGGQIPVVNLKALNTFLHSEHLKMEGLHILPDLI